jgi:DNA-binding transcriptional MerR regulator
MDSNVLHIGEASRVLGVTPDHLRKLERAGRVPPVDRDFAGRVYSPSDIALLRDLGVGSRPQRLRTFEVFGDG